MSNEPHDGDQSNLLAPRSDLDDIDLADLVLMITRHPVAIGRLRLVFIGSYWVTIVARPGDTPPSTSRLPGRMKRAKSFLTPAEEMAGVVERAMITPAIRP